MRRKSKRYLTLATVIAKMPSLKHKPNASFDIMKSEVVTWLIDQPMVRQEIFDYYKRFMVFDPETRTWSGSGVTVVSLSDIATSSSFSSKTMVRVEAPF